MSAMMPSSEEPIDYQHCAEASNGVHAPDWSTVSHDTDAPPNVIDVACRYCGASGSCVVEAENINW